MPIMEIKCTCFICGHTGDPGDYYPCYDLHVCLRCHTRVLAVLPDLLGAAKEAFTAMENAPTWENDIPRQKLLDALSTALDRPGLR
jgi:hypothetical protein